MEGTGSMLLNHEPGGRHGRDAPSLSQPARESAGSPAWLGIALDLPTPRLFLSDYPRGGKGSFFPIVADERILPSRP
jgi:hypothetical protein